MLPDVFCWRLPVHVRPFRRLASLLCVAVAWLAVAGAACSPTETDAQRAEAIIDRTMSPFCPGRTLASCPSPNAAAWRSEIRQWTRDGVSTAEIRRRIEARAGSSLSGTPEGPLGWKLPLIVAAASMAVLGLVLRRLLSARSRRSKNKPDSAVSRSAAANADLDQRLASELDALDADRDDP
jgi:cytochrome c-type biogenesis protein CcmH/NrfF